MENKKLLILFPGRNYSTDKPLLYFGAMVFSQKGYEIIRLDYNFSLKGDKEDIKGLIEEAKSYVDNVLEKIDFSMYKDVVFLSKSMGTALAGYAEKKYSVKARHIFLTPVAQALPYMNKNNCIVISGKNDRYLDSVKLKIYCVENEIAIKQFEDVGHSLECGNNLNITLSILMVIIKMYRQF